MCDSVCSWDFRGALGKGRVPLVFCVRARVREFVVAMDVSPLGR